MDKKESTLWGERVLKSFIDRTTMYRLMLYYLLILVTAAIFLSAIGVLPYDPTAILWSVVVLLTVSWLVNTSFARLYGAVTNVESVFITALILALIFQPVAYTDVAGFIMLAIVAFLANASKYVFAIQKKHVFNPAALAAVISALLFGVPATWWAAGNLALLPFVLVGGLVIVYKLRRFDLVLAFSVSAIGTVALVSHSPVASIQTTLLYSVFFFFAFIMLTEPLTTPPTRALRVVYGALVGILFITAPSICPFYFSPELALIAGNLFSYFVSPKVRYMLSLAERRPLAGGIYEYIFRSDRRLRFLPGQYLEWTLAQRQIRFGAGLGGVPLDARGNRRFFTIASAPEEETIALGTRLPEEPSAFKRTLAELPIGGVISASSLGGEFVMPKDTKRKLAFIAGGIGVTPFTSMARHCIASGERRDAVLLYANKTASEVAYRDIFTDTERVGWRTAYRVGAIDAEYIKSEVPDYSKRLFYISGPPGMVDAMKRALLTLGVSRFNIKTDFFPGLA
ncbi:MAG: hypothetical protein Q7R58_01410 [bacterium]|nr:hypothetical protein [bacterium]